jgi:hypothetical protein
MDLRMRVIRERGVRAVVATAICLCAAAGPAGAWDPVVTVSDGFQRGILDDMDDVAAGGSAVHSLLYLEDFGDLDVHVGYSSSGLTHDVNAKVLDARCDVAEGIAADGDQVVALCSRSNTWDIRIRQLLLYRIHGGTWGKAMQVQGSSQPSDDSASIAISGDLVVVAWTDRRNGKVLLRRSTDGGKTFQAAIALGEATMLGTMYEGRSPNGRVQVAVRGTHVYAAWFPGSTKTARGLRPVGLRLRRSANGGRTFVAAQTLSRSVEWPTAPSMVATDAGMLVLHATSDGRVRLLRSVDQGASFQSTALTATKGMDDTVDLAASGQEVRAIWRLKAKVFLRRSADGGGTWSATEDTGVSRRQDIDIRANVVLFGSTTAVAWSAADPVWEDLGGAWVNITSTP